MPKILALNRWVPFNLLRTENLAVVEWYSDRCAAGIVVGGVMAGATVTISTKTVPDVSFPQEVAFVEKTVTCGPLNLDTISVERVSVCAVYAVVVVSLMVTK